MGSKKKKRLVPKQNNSLQSSPKVSANSQNFSEIIKKCTVFFENKSTFFSKHSLWFEIIALIIVIAVGISFRLEDLEQWHKYEQKAFFNKQPLHTTFDAWFYLSLAQDLVDGTYNPINEMRGVPDCPPRPSPPPLISVMAAGIAKATSFSLSWIGAVLPTILGSLLAIPLYLLGRFYGGPVMGITAALMSLLYPFYIYRSNIGRFDTDCLNATWAVSSAYVFLRFGIEKTKKRYLYFLGGIIIYGLFLWWWDQTPAAATAITIMPLAVALAFFYRPEGKEGKLFYAITGCALIVFLLTVGPDKPVKIIKSIWLNYLYISKDSSGTFPNIGITISEQSKPSLALIISYTTKNILAFIFAITGVFLLFWKHFKNSLFLVSLVVLSIATFFANRFLIFMIPMVALGTGFSMSMLWGLRKRFAPLYLICPLLIVLFVWPLYLSNKTYIQWPKEPGPTAEGMYTVQQKTPSDAVIWAWWDHGHALTYLARRAAINDGIIHGGERTVYTAIPLTTDSYRMAANFMQFYVIRGKKGIKQFYKAAGNKPAAGLKLIKKILRAGPADAVAIIKEANLKPIGNLQNTQDWLEFFFPAEKRPVYLFLDNLLPKIAYWWYWFGTWDIEKQDGRHPVFKIFYNMHNKKDQLIAGYNFILDKKTGKLHMGNRTIQLSFFGIRKKNAFEKKSYNNNSTYRFEYFERSRYGALMDSEISESVFNKLYIRHLYHKKYFKPLKLRPPYYQIWEVKGDSLSDYGM